MNCYEGYSWQSADSLSQSRGRAPGRALGGRWAGAGRALAGRWPIRVF